MNYKIFENRLKYLKKTYGPELWNMTVTANKIEGKAFLILKNSNNGKVIECILLTDETDKFKEEPTVDPDDELREELEIL